jgi:hypothetical protein
VFINLKTDPRILHSSPCHTCVNLPPIAFGLPLTSALGHSRSDATRTPTHVCARTLLCSSSVIHPPLSTSQKYSSDSLWSHTHVYRPHSELCVYPCYEFSELHSEPLLISALRVSQGSEPFITTLDPHLCSSSQSIHLLYLHVQTLAIQLHSDVCPGVCLGVHSDICVSFHLTSLSPRLWTLFRPPSLSVLQVSQGSELLVT